MDKQFIHETLVEANQALEEIETKNTKQIDDIRTCLSFFYGVITGLIVKEEIESGEQDVQCIINKDFKL